MEPPNGRHFSLQEQQMSARKLGRLAGLVFVLAAVFGGVAAATAGAQHEAGGSTPVVTSADAIQMRNLETVWG
jgi:hypothetical protein